MSISTKNLPQWDEVYHEIKLGKWVNKQRCDKRSSKMTLERKKALEAIHGWSWGQKETWYRTYSLLCEYVKEHQKLPSRTDIYYGVKLGLWIDNQRKAKRNYCTGKLTPDRVAALEKIPGWIWEQNFDKIWYQTCALLYEYVYEHQKLPQSNEVYHEINLGKWVNNQRYCKKKR